ncbi:MAG TPA: tetratricopeptide repeat protein [Ferruginibacter sp.]|nr:tetratricopeptide repeat protein [Ferruginibacter sp.]
MKYFLYLSLLLMMACNNEEGTQTNESLPSKEKQLTDAVKQYPDSVIMVENLAQYYRENEAYEQALLTINQAIKRDSSIAKYWHMKGILHYENADTVQAIASLETSIRLSKNLTDLLLLAKIYAETKNPLTITLCDDFIKQNEFVKEAIFIKGLYFRNIHENEKAFSYFDEAIAAGYTFMEPYIEKAKLLYDQGKYMDALLVLDKALKVNNSYAEGYYHMGRCFEKLDRLADAKESYETTLIYNSDYQEAREALAALEKKLP